MATTHPHPTRRRIHLWLEADPLPGESNTAMDERMMAVIEAVLPEHEIYGSGFDFDTKVRDMTVVVDELSAAQVAELASRRLRIESIELVWPPPHAKTACMPEEAPRGRR